MEQPPEDQRESPALSEAAAEFLNLIGPEELESCLFTETLEVVAAEDQPGVQITGQWWAAVRWAPYKQEGKPARSCLLVQAGFRIRQDNVPCSSTLKAYVTPLLETLEQEEQERLEVTGVAVVCPIPRVLPPCSDAFLGTVPHLKAQPVERTTHMVNHHHGMTVTKTIQEGEAEPKSWSFFYLQDDLRGLLPEGASILLLRVLAHLQAVPPDLIFPAFDTEGQLCISSYRAVGFQQQAVGSVKAEVLVIERSVQASADTSTVWHSSFLPSGRLVRRVQIGSPMLVLLQNESVLGETGGVKPQPFFPKQPLDWEEDIQLYSWFLDRKEELQASHSDYLQQHPEYWAVQHDFLQALLLRQPCDLISFADEFFAPFSHQRPPETRFAHVKAVRPSPRAPPPSPFSV